LFEFPTPPLINSYQVVAVTAQVIFWYTIVLLGETIAGATFPQRPLNWCEDFVFIDALISMQILMDMIVG
jgi:hypothetical protein